MGTNNRPHPNKKVYHLEKRRPFKPSPENTIHRQPITHPITQRQLHSIRPKKSRRRSQPQQLKLK